MSDEMAVRPGEKADFVERWLRRKTSGAAYSPEIDGLRFVFIAMVVLFHLNGYVAEKIYRIQSAGAPRSVLHPLLGEGHWGVQLFFVLSGFVIAQPFVRFAHGEGRRVRLRDYYLRRVTRLEPPYVLAMVLLAGLLIVTKGEPLAHVVPHLGASVVYLHNVVYRVPSTIAVVAWSLEIEIQFYLIAPLLMLALRLPGAARRGVLGGAALLIAGLVTRPSPLIALTVLPFLPYFLVGMVLSDLRYGTRGASPRLAFDAVALAGIVAFALVRWFGGSTLLLLCAVAVGFYGAFHGKWTLRFLSNRWVSAIGGMCYSIYLLHYAVIAAVGRVSARVPSTGVYAVDLLVQCAIHLPLVLVLSGLYFVLIERPCMDPAWPARLREWIRARRRPAPRGASTGQPAPERVLRS